MLPGAALGSLHVRSRCPSAFHTRHTLGSLAARFCWQGQHFRLWTVPERVSGPPPLMLPGAALGSLAARFCWQGQHFRLWTVPERVSGPPPLMLPGAALGSLAARFCWQGQHVDSLTHTRQTLTRSLTVPFAALQALDGTRARFGAPPLDAARCSTWESPRLLTVPERVSN